MKTVDSLLSRRECTRSDCSCETDLLSRCIRAFACRSIYSCSGGIYVLSVYMLIRVNNVSFL